MPAFDVTIDKFYGGISDVRTLMSDNQFLYGKGLDGQSEPDYLQLVRNVNSVMSTSTFLMLAFAEDGLNLFSFGEGGRIYHTNGNLVGTVTDGSVRIIYNVAKFDDKFLMFYEFGSGVCRIAEIPLADATTGAGSWNANITVDAYADVGYPSSNIPNYNRFFSYVIADRYLFFPTGKTIGRIEKGANIVVKADIEFEDNVVSITRHGPQFRVYLENGKVYFWDGFASYAEAALDFGVGIRYVSNQGKKDYVATGTAPRYGQMYVASGYNMEILKKSAYDYELLVPKFHFQIANPGGNMIMAEYESLLYTSCVVENNTGDGTGLMTFGKQYTGFPTGFFIHSDFDSQGNDVNTIGAIYKPRTASPFIYYSTKDGNGNCRVNMINISNQGNYNPALNNFLSEGVMYSRKFDLGAPEKTKFIDELAVRCILLENESIVIRYILNGQSTFTNLATLSGPHNGEKVIVPLASSINFHEIIFEITLNTTRNPRATSPKFRCLTFRGEVIEDGEGE